MKKLLAVLVLLALGVAAGVAWSRGWVDALLATEVADLSSEADHADGSTVRLHGTVSSRLDVPFSDQGFFQLGDGSAQAWIRTTGGLPPKGARVTVRGSLQRSSTDLGIAELKGLHVDAERVWVH